MDTQIALAGYVGNDIEFASGPDWTGARFRLGCTPRWRKGSEWVAGETTWMTVRTSGTTACYVRDSLRKGDPVVVVGRLRTRTWQDPAGDRRQQLVVEAQALGHNITKGVSSFARPERPPQPPEDDEPLGPDIDSVVLTPDAGEADDGPLADQAA